MHSCNSFAVILVIIFRHIKILAVYRDKAFFSIQVILFSIQVISRVSN